MYYFCEPNILIFDMFSSQKNIDSIILLYQIQDQVFNLKDIAVLFGETNFSTLSQKLNYYVRTGKLLNPRKGIYAKPGYSAEELAGKIYTPSYISLEYVLQQAGVVFQYDSRVTCVSYLSREIEVQAKTLSYRKIKGEILANMKGLELRSNVWVATPERACLDLLYLDKNYFFDNFAALNKRKIEELLPVYNSKALTARVQNLLKNHGH